MKKQSRSITVLLSIYVLYGLAQACGEYRILFLESHGLTATECGYALAGASLLAAIARPLAGALADRLRSCRVVYIGAVTSWLALLALLLLTQHVRLANLSLCVGIIPLLEIGNQVTYGMIESDGVNATLLNPGLDFSLIRVCLSIGYSVINFLYTPIVNRFGPLAPFACTMLYLAALLALSGSLRSFETTPDSGDPDAPRRENLGISRLFQNYYLVCFVVLNLLMSLGTQTTNYQFACITFEEGTTKERFREYLETVLLPSIYKGDYVIMDNLRTHHCNFVEELIRSAGAVLLYLPPYSPDLNPIEMMWSKMKSVLRKWRIRVKDKLISAAREALNVVTPSDCDGWFANAGY